MNARDGLRSVTGLTRLHEWHRRVLMQDVVPFWLRYAVDREYGGLFTCLRDDGSMISSDKYLWSQCRAVWTFSALYNRIEQREEFLGIARDTAGFVLRHGRDDHGDFVFQTTRDGKSVQGAVSIYTDMFAVYGLTELHRATSELRYLEEAVQIYRRAMDRIRRPDFNGFAPYSQPEGVRWVHGIPMIGLEVGQELADSAPEKNILEFVDQCLHRIMDHHVRPEGCLLEHLDVGDRPVDSPAGRAALPGHAIESMWFVMHQARRRKDRVLALRASEVIRRMVEAGWDTEKGGLYLAIDVAGGVPWWKHAEKKLWWPHVEALYALLLAYEWTREQWCLDWYDKIFDWSLDHFPDHLHGEWHQKLDRDGRVIDEVIALPVKDPFHLPRSLILSISALQRLITENPK